MFWFLDKEGVKKMSEIEIEGKNVEEAIEKGLKELNISRDEVEIKILNEGASGLFGLMGSKPARVQIKTRESAGEKVAKVTKKETVSAESDIDLNEVAKKGKEILGQILSLSGIKSEIRVEIVGDKVLLSIESEDGALLIGKKGATLDAIELITNLMVARQTKIGWRVIVDTEDYRIRQEKKLVDAAHSAAEEVKQSGEEYRFEPMSSRDRRTIHSALQDDPDVETISEGEGSQRQLIVRPKSI